MPITPLSNLMAARPEENELPPVTIDLTQAEPEVTFEDGARKTELPDGSVQVDLNGSPSKPKSDKFDANLAEELDQTELNKIASDLLEGIKRDDQSRQDHLKMIAEGMKLLGLVIESANASQASSSAPLEGMSSVRHPLLLEACQLFQANALGELLPAAGPVKVRDDRPEQPPIAANPFASLPGVPSSPPGIGAPGAGNPPVPPSAGMLPPQGVPNGPQASPPQPAPAPMAAPMAQVPGPAMAGSGSIPDPEEERDELADALEKDFNHYLTVTDKAYYADTDQMFFKVGFGGLGVKKVYNCPLKRMPISRSVDIEDFIVSNALSDLADARRITHRIKMSPSTLRRMQIVKAYRDVQLSQPTQADSQGNTVDQTKAEVAGIQPSADPRDADYEIFECYCELDLDEFAPKQFKGKGLALPYKVTIEKESEQVLEIRRNWREKDEQCLAKEYFVDFPYMRAFGFYCIGLLHLLGNTTKALTALWREFIDAGMFANFPGFLYLKGAGRQLTNQFRVAPGSGIGLDAAVEDIRQAVMPLPYKSPDAAFTAFVQHVEELGQRLGGTANTAVAEGRADAPVGTTLALIEQASKPVAAVNKRLHSSQDREFQLLKERFKDDPEAFWRFNKRPTQAWTAEQFLKALEDYDLTPVADPNNPTRLHRMAKAEAYRQVVAAAPTAFVPSKAMSKYFHEIGIEGAEETFSPNIDNPPQPPQAQPDPAKLADVQHKNAKLAADQQQAQQDNAVDIQKLQMQHQNDAAERENKLALAQMAENTERLRLASTVAIHSSELEQADKAANIKLASDHLKLAYDHAHQREMKGADQAHQAATATVAHERGRQVADEAHDRAKELAASKPTKEAN